MKRVPVGPFDVWEPIGRGGMGQVWRGEHRDTGAPVALKVLHHQALRDGNSGDSFRNEVRSVAALDHPGIVWVFDVGEIPRDAAVESNGLLAEGAPYLAMEFAAGGTLGDFVPRSWEAVRDMLSHLLEALGHAHAHQVVHRDLKPGNVLLCAPTDVRPGWKLTDFGIAAALEETAERSIARGIVGTLAYMSPEQIRANWREFGPWTDLYALGCIVYRVVGNQRPFREMRGPALITAHLTQKPQVLVPRVAVPQGFAEWVEVLLQKRPGDRFQSAAEALRALSQLGPAVPVPSDLLPQPLEDRLLDEPTADADGPTELVRARPTLDPSAVPLDWRRTEAPWPSPRLIGAGLGLFGVRAIPMVGRVGERNALWSELREVATPGRARVVLLRGAGGVGKSRLARWLGETAHAVAGLPFLIGEARAGEEAEGALARPFRRYFRTVRLDDDERLGRLRTALGSDNEELVRSLSAMLSDDGEAHGQRIEGEARHLLARRVLERIAAPRRPVVLLLDDAHASPDLLRFTRHLLEAQSVRPSPILVVLTVTTESVGGEPEARAELLALGERVTTLPVLPLSAEEHERLIQAILPLDRTLAAQLADWTAGNPQHAVMVLREWVARGRLALGQGGFELVGAEPVAPPLAEVWRERLEAVLVGLPDPARVLLERAAALGHTVDEDEWQRVCDDPKGVYAADGRVRFVPEHAAIRAELRERLLGAWLVEETSEGWSFTHQLLRQALLSMAGEAGRLHSHHRACARMLLHRSDGRRHAERIGRHLLAGNRAEMAIPQLLEGFRSRRRAAGDAAALPILGVAEQALREAGVAESDPRWAELLVLRAELFARVERSEDADRWASQAAERAAMASSPILEARAGLVSARVRLQRGDAGGADVALARLEALLRPGDDPRTQGELQALRSQAAGALGDRVRARGHAVLAAQAFTEAGERTGLASGWAVLGESALREGALDEADRYLERARGLHERVGNAVGAATALTSLGEVAEARGDLERSRTLLSRAVERFRDAGSTRVAAASLALARVHLARREWGEARRLALESIGRGEFVRSGPLEVGANAVQVAASAALRDWTAFDLHLERVRAAVEEGLRELRVASSLELAGHRAEAARERERAAEARRLVALIRG